MLCMTRQLEGSVAARWRVHTAGVDEQQRRWKTRVGYYRAVSAALSGGRGPGIDARGIIQNHPKGKQSTLYSVAGTGALVTAYQTHSGPVRKVGDLVEPDPLAKLVAETKVWSFWPFRAAWVQELDVRFPAGDLEPAEFTLARALQRWHAERPELGAAGDGLPPLCAVEDLVVLSRFRFSAAHAAERLLTTDGYRPEAAAAPSVGHGPGRDCPRPAARLRGDPARLAEHVGKLNRAIDLLRQAGLAEGPVIQLLDEVVREMTGAGRG